MFSNKFIKVPVKFDTTTDEEEAIGLSNTSHRDGFTNICPDDIVEWLPVSNDDDEGFVKVYVLPTGRGFWIYWSPERFLQEMDNWSKQGHAIQA